MTPTAAMGQNHSRKRNNSTARRTRIMTQSMHRRPTVGGTERDTFSRASRKPGRRTNATVKRKALQRERRATRMELRQHAF